MFSQLKTSLQRSLKLELESVVQKLLYNNEKYYFSFCYTLVNQITHHFIGYGDFVNLSVEISLAAKEI